MKRVLALVLLAGCSDEPVQVQPLVMFCEDAIRDAIRTPASYQRVSAAESLPDLIASITFDAQNLYGAVTRSSARCEYTDRFDVKRLTIDGSDVPVR